MLQCLYKWSKYIDLGLYKNSFKKFFCLIKLTRPSTNYQRSKSTISLGVFPDEIRGLSFQSINQERKKICVLHNLGNTTQLGVWGHYELLNGFSGEQVPKPLEYLLYLTQN